MRVPVRLQEHALGHRRGGIAGHLAGHVYGEVGAVKTLDPAQAGHPLEHVAPHPARIQAGGADTADAGDDRSPHHAGCSSFEKSVSTINEWRPLNPLQSLSTQWISASRPRLGT